MHRTLHILEIIVDVFSLLDKKSLSVLARTCRSFHEPALDLLWREQESLLPLLKCLPQNQWVEEKTALGTTILVSLDILVCMPDYKRQSI